MAEIKPVAEWTADEIVAIIPRVLHDAQAVETLIRLLAVRDPHRAQAVLDTLELAFVVLDRERAE